MYPEGRCGPSAAARSRKSAPRSACAATACATDNNTPVRSATGDLTRPGARSPAWTGRFAEREFMVRTDQITAYPCDCTLPQGRIRSASAKDLPDYSPWNAIVANRDIATTVFWIASHISTTVLHEVDMAKAKPAAKPHAVINFYSTTGEYGCFSNFSKHAVHLKGKRWA